MGDLNIFELPLGNMTLEKLNILDANHISIMESMRDYMAKEMCYDVKYDIFDEMQEASRNCFLAKNSDGYFGYMNISDDRDGNRILCYIVQKKLRGMGLGKVLLTEVSDYLLDNNIASTVKINVSKQNTPGIKLAVFCGFKPLTSAGGDMITYAKKL